jgi:hypothetical protein
VPSFAQKSRSELFVFSTVVFQTIDTYSHLLPLLQEGAASALKKVLF